MSETAIVIENLGKRYVIGKRKQGVDGMRHALEGVIRSPGAWLRSRREAKLRQVDFWALRHVDLSINQGEVVGIIGRNGAGKSTLLKLLSRITVPTEGRFRINGRAASLLEVGTGFHQELSGRENIFLNGAILGMTRVEIARKFDQIVEFSDIEDFLDTPVKRYSSGMYVRLAFAVAAHLEPEILIVDEVLAVGDAAFQAKCLGKMGEVAQDGRTVIFVSHNMEAIRSLCQRAILLDEGRVRADGEVENVVADYFARLSSSSARQLTGANGLVIEKVTLKNGEGQETRQLCPGEDLIVEISYNSPCRIELPYFLVIVEGIHGKCFTASMLLDGMRPEVLEGAGQLSCRFKGIPLLPQRYSISLSIREKAHQSEIWACKDALSFTVKTDLKSYGYKGDYLTHAPRSTSVVIPYVWELPDGTTVPVGLTIPREDSH
jgi:lipopolysaccharide transport system ATP-binding protein